MTGEVCELYLEHGKMLLDCGCDERPRVGSMVDFRVGFLGVSDDRRCPL